MKVKDDSLWQGLIKELDEVEEGKDFREFLVAWCSRAEQIVEQDSNTDPADALRLTLENTEDALVRQNIWVLAQGLTVIIMHWIHGDQVAGGLTELEARLVQDVTAAKIAQLQAMAESTAPE